MKLSAPFACLLVLTGCVTPSEKKEIRSDIFNMQTRLLTLEGQLNEGKQVAQTSGDSQNKRLASTSAELERMNHEIKKISGEIDSLKVGVTMGQMPGQEKAPEGSVAAQLADIKERLQAIEATQSEIEAKLATKRPSKTSDSGTPSVHADIDSLQKAFDRKKYKEVVQDAPTVLRKSKAKTKEQATFLYAESLFRLKRYQDAAIQYNELTELKPDQKLQASAKFRLGECFRFLGDKDASKAFYQEVVQKFPESPEADKAKSHLGTTKESSKANSKKTRG
jgi:TolA-binding protein